MARIYENKIWWSWNLDAHTPGLTPKDTGTVGLTLHHFLLQGSVGGNAVTVSYAGQSHTLIVPANGFPLEFKPEAYVMREHSLTITLAQGGGPSLGAVYIQAVMSATRESAEEP